MHVFVTGASGFIGQAVITDLLSHNHTVLGLARSDASARAITSLGASVHRGSLHDLESLQAGARATDATIHLAFEHDFANYLKGCETDRAAIAAMGEVLAGTNRPFIITSGTMMLPAGRVATEDDLPDTVNPLAAARGESETLVKGLVERGVRTSVMRLAPTNHGDGDHGFIAILIGVAREKGRSVYVGDGENRWPAVHRLDTAVAYRLALEKAGAGSTFHVVAEEGVRMRDIAEMIGRKLNVPVESLSMDKAQEHFGPFGFAIAADNLASNKKTREVLGWDPKQKTLIEDLEEGTYFSA